MLLNKSFLPVEYGKAGMYLILGILMLVMFYIAGRRLAVKEEGVILLIVFFGTLTTYFIPRMHDRYYYMVDAFLVVYVFLRLRRLPMLVASSFTMIMGYAQFLTENKSEMSHGIMAFVQLLLLIWIGMDMYAYLHDPDNAVAEETETRFDLHEFVFHPFHIGKFSFRFLDLLLVCCISVTGLLMRSCFPDYGSPGWSDLLPEYALAVAAALLVRRVTDNRSSALMTYGILVILPTIVADGTILQGNSCVGALLLLAALLLLEWNHAWGFSVLLSAALLLNVTYVGILAACVILWKRRSLRLEQLLLPMAAGAARFLHSYRIWLGAGYTLTTFQWPNIYEIVGTESVLGQQADPAALVGITLALGLSLIAAGVIGHEDTGTESAGTGSARTIRLCLFFGLLATYFLPYMNQSCGYIYCILAVVLMMMEPEHIWIALLLQLVSCAAYQACISGDSVMPMWIYSVLQFGIIAYLGVGLLRDTARKNKISLQKEPV